ncbi:MAG TPA: tetratricopeptide repeat protein [Verrucomicrobiales bacterium]|nr:tetratricopeptide repeat protein [Verrucomicrobiales bacterium]
MKRLLLLITCTWVSLTAADEAEFRQRIDAARHAKDDKAWTAAIDEWKKAEPKSPEPLIAEANQLFSKASIIRLDARPPKKGELELKNPKTGETAGSIGAGAPDSELCGKAVAVLKKALELAPERLDIRCGMAHLCQESGRFDEELEILKTMASYALAHPAEQRWLKGGALDKPTDKFVAEKLHSYGLHYYNQETTDGEKKFGAIAKIVTESYPDNPVGWNDLALFRYLTEKNTKAAAECLEKAAALDPSDKVVQFNLAKFYSELGENAKAKAIYEQVIKNSKKPEDVKAAKQKLKELEKERLKKTL